jgi:hypothetical protein
LAKDAEAPSAAAMQAHKYLDQSSTDSNHDKSCSTAGNGWIQQVGNILLINV